MHKNTVARKPQFIKATYYPQASPLPSASITLTGSKGFSLH